MNKSKKRILILLFAAALLVSVSQAAATKNIDFDWKFKLSDTPAASKAGFDDSEWRVLDLPHDWSVEGAYSPDNTPQNSWLPVGVGWYRKTIDVPDEWLDRKVLLRFEGVYMNSQVWLNGYPVGGRPYGFMSFSCDLSKHLKAGQNTIAVRVDNTPAPTARFYHGSGIYGHVDLVNLPKVHIEPNGGVFARTENCNSSGAILCVDTEVVNGAPSSQKLTVAQRIKDRDGKVIAKSKPKAVEVAPGRTETVSQDVEVDSPRLWSPTSPYLYTLETVIESDGEVLDSVKTPVGIRTICFDAATGFWINGDNIKLKGGL